MIDAGARADITLGKTNYKSLAASRGFHLKRFCAMKPFYASGKGENPSSTALIGYKINFFGDHSTVVFYFTLKFRSFINTECFIACISQISTLNFLSKPTC